MGVVTPTELLRREGDALVERLRVWTPARWAAGAPVLGTRADVAHHLAQRRRVLPRLDSDLVLADQLAVTLDDLVRAGPPPGVARRATAHLLLHRTHLLGDEVPPRLADALYDDLVTVREECGQTTS